MIMTSDSIRFSGIERLLGKEALVRLSSSHILVVGLGGVGSWALESLVRSGVGEVTLVDFDEVCVSNINRQLHALSSTIGKSKAKVLHDRCKDINPECKVNVIEDFFSADTEGQIFSSNYDMVIDAIDALSAKALLVKLCRDKNIPLIVTGGAGGKTDPTKIIIDDLAKTLNDPLLQKLRKFLRQRYEFPRGKRSKFGVMAVYSTELPVLPENCEVAGSLDCSTGYGTSSYITATFGFFAAYKAIDQVLASPKK
jgi:tRNA A37 threonylcarbamoyladenosine dehydratase